MFSCPSRVIGTPRLTRSLTRQALLVSTILGAGVLIVLPGGSKAADYVYTGPAASGQPETSLITGSVKGTDKVFITTTAGGTVTGNVAGGTTSGVITANSVDGDIALNFGDTVQNTTTISGGPVVARSTGAGSITLTGAGNLITSGARGSQFYTATGAITIGGTGTSSGGVTAISAQINSSTASSDILINRSGAISAYNSGVVAINQGSGKIIIQGIGEVTSGGSYGINSAANSGATLIDLTKNVTAGSTVNTSGNAIYATSTTGDITIKTATGVALTSGSTSVSVTSTGGGNINIGGAAGLGGAVSGSYGIGASTTGTGTINVKTASGGAITASNGNGIQTTAVGGATTITIGAGSTVTGTTNAIQTTTTNGNVVANNAGTVNGSLNAVLSSGGTGTFTFNNSGTLALVGSQSNTGFALKNQSGGVLTGTGSFGVVNAASGSTIRAGDRTLALVNGVPQMGTLNATSLTLAAGAIVDVRVDYSGVSDTVAVTGAAALNGATLSIKASPKVDATWADKKTFNVLTAGSITGTFADTIQTDYAFLKFTAAYSATGVSVTSDRNWTSFGTYASTSNQRSVSDVFDKLQSQTTNPVIQRVTTLTVTQAPVALSQLSGTGVVATRTQAFAAGGVFSGAINSEMGKFTSSAGGGSSALSYAQDSKIKSKAFDKIAPKPEPIPDGRIWAQILGGIGNMKSDATNPSQRASNYGLAAGADTAINANLRAGFALSLGQSTTKVSSLATSTESTWGQGALYGVATDGDTYLKGALTFGYLDNTSDRIVSAFGTNEQAKGKFGANLYSLRLEAGQKFGFDHVNLTPFFAFEPSLLVQNAYKETGPASITLGFDKTTSRALPTTLGVKADASYDLGDYRMTPSASLGWVHDFANSGSISPFFTALPGSNFTAQGSRGDRNLARTEINLEASPMGTLATIYLNARADVGSRTNAVRGVAGVSLRF